MKKTPAPEPLAGRIVGFSIAVAEDLPALGFGPEHLREVLLVVARTVLRLGADVCYGGHLKKSGSFTRDLIDLISAEQRDAAMPTNANPGRLGRLFNPIPWPFYEDLTVADLANWVDCYTAVRISPTQAGLPVPASDAPKPRRGPIWREEYRATYQAVVLTVMRRMQVEGFAVPKPLGGTRRIEASMLLGGKVATATGLAPGLFEEAFYAMRKKIPVYLLGGFGGASAVLGQALRGQFDCFDEAYEQFQQGKNAADLAVDFTRARLPASILRPAALRKEIRAFLKAAAKNPIEALNNGLSLGENAILFQSTNAAEAAHLIGTALRRRFEH